MPPPYAAVYFDCDSTLSSIEGVDELLHALDPALRAEIAAMTELAMNGQAPLAAIYETRLDRIAPHRDLLDEIGALYVARAVPHAGDVIAALHFLRIETGIISGGLLVPVRHLAAHLGVPADNVHAVPLLFHDDGRYRDFDRRSPLWQNGGKVTVIAALPDAHRPVAFVGDGITDLEVQGTADLFIGFGGVADREAVRSKAERFVAGPSLAGVLRHVLTEVQLDSLSSEPAFASLLSAVDR
ncbi:MAG: HAD-IB family phosphatase [Planctomycetes bacterium]|nr:HAD-IB family phosphatase [Planctomycetota bacterium]